MDKLNNGDVLKLLLENGDDIYLTSSKLAELLQSSDDAIRRRIKRLKQKQPKKNKQSDEYKLWESTPFISSMPCETLSQPCIGPAGDAVGDAATIRGQRGRPSKRLCDSPGRTTTATILEEPIKYLTEFSEKQGVSFDDVLTALLSTRPKKQKSNVKVNIPEQDATAFYFNNSFSTRSWTELHLFLLEI